MIMSGGDVGESIESQVQPEQTLTGWSLDYTQWLQRCRFTNYSTFRTLQMFKWFRFFYKLHILQTESKIGAPDGIGIGG